MAKVQAHLIINGQRIASGEADFGSSRDDPRIAYAQFGDLRVAVMVEKPEIDALKPGRTFGLKHLRALIDALPKCSFAPMSKLEPCPLVATWEEGPGPITPIFACDVHQKHLGGTRRELPYAPAARYIRMQQQEWEERFAGDNQNPGSGPSPEGV
jgi:hypothetical protein